MKKMYRVLSLLLCAIIMSAVCVVAAADETIMLTDKDFKAKKRLEAIGIIDKTEENEMLKTPTRAEVAELMVRFINLPATSSDDVVSPFIDVASTDESAAAITALYNMGYISRGDDLKFNPKQTATANEAVTFVVKAMGYKAFAEANGGYPTGYFLVASRYDILKDVKINGSEPIYMYELYHMINKALDAPALEYMGYMGDSDQYNMDKSYTILAKYWQGYQKTGIVTGNDVTSLKKAEAMVSSGEIKIDNTVYSLATDVSYDLLGKCVTVYALSVDDDNDTLIYIEENTKKNSTEVLDYSVLVPAKTTNSVLVYEDREANKEKEIDIDTNCDVIYNGVCWTGFYNLREALPAYGYVELVDNNGNNAIDVIKVYDYKNMVVSYSDTYEEIIYERDANGNDLSYDSEVAFTLIDSETNEEITPDKLVYGDVITFIRSKNGAFVEAYVSKKTVEGKIGAVSTINGQTVYNIDGIDYKTAIDGIASLTIGTQGEFVLDYLGNILEIRYDTENNGDYILGVLMGLQDEGNDFNGPARVKFYNADGEAKEYYTKEKVVIDGVRKDMTQTAVKNEVQAYAGNLVRYKLSDDKVAEFDFAYVPDKGAGGTTADHLGTLTAIATGTQIQRRSYVYRMGNDFNFYVHGNSKLFIVPTNPIDEENYIVTTPTEFMKNGHTYTATGTDGTFTKVLPNLSVNVYNLGTPQDTCEIGTTIVMKCDPIGAWSQGGSFRVVSAMTKVYDESQNAELTRIYFDGSNSDYYTVSDTINFINNAGKDQFSKTNLKVGDTVTFGLDNEGIIRTLQIWYRKDQTNTTDVTLREGSWLSSTSFDAQPLRGVGIVTGIDTTKKIISYKTPDGAKNWMVSYSSPTVLLVRSDVERTGKVEKITPQAIKVGDRIVFDASLASCSNIVVYR